VALLPHRVRDDEAYEERLAIMVEAGEDSNVIYSKANEAAFRTPYSHVATAAFHGDWAPLCQYCLRAGAVGPALLAEIAEKVFVERQWRDAIERSQGTPKPKGVNSLR
jgi:hypothetical protein